MIQEIRGYRARLPAVRGLDEHFSQGELPIADVAKSDRSDDRLAVEGQPSETAGAHLIETLDVEQVRLLCECDVQAEFVALDWKDHLGDSGLVARGECFDHFAGLGSYEPPIGYWNRNNNRD
jgi:hypothetical protein